MFGAKIVRNVVNLIEQDDDVDEDVLGRR